MGTKKGQRRKTARRAYEPRRPTKIRTSKGRSTYDVVGTIKSFRISDLVFWRVK